MAFNFNWSPLTADASFYTRAQELLTTALNKSPKPPIIVDDILVNELNLGSVPPDLEILEIGDLAEDRFRGIFKMCYSGDAFLTLKTRVQANPLNTYLSTKPSFASPQPLAAASGLTIPLQITLSEIKLSAFIIVVFSKQKGLTLVFRNDPLESLKVSSTFDVIPFVRDYLQKEIEGQLRTLLMDEVPVIIHRLSLRLWVPEHREREDEELARNMQESGTEEKPVDPLASPPQDPVDISGNVLDASQIASLSLDSGSEAYQLFSQKNLLRLSALTDSHRTLSLSTPSIRDAVFRAWAGPTERGETRGSSGKATPVTPGITRSHSFSGNTSTTYIFADSTDGSHHSRPSLGSYASAASGLGLGSSKHGKPHGRKKKRRIVNLRKKTPAGEDMESVSGDSTALSGSGTGTVSEPLSVPSTPSEYIARPRTPEQAEEWEPGDWDIGNTPPQLRTITPRHLQREPLGSQETTPHASQLLNVTIDSDSHPPSSLNPSQRPRLHNSQPLRHSPLSTTPLQVPPSSQTTQPTDIKTPAPSLPIESPTTEPTAAAQTAWMNKMASEIMRKVADQKALSAGGDGGFWGGGGREEGPPPPYAS